MQCHALATNRTRRTTHAAGIVFILGINFEAGDWSLTNSQLKAIRQELPPGSVLAVELGNEVGLCLPLHEAAPPGAEGVPPTKPKFSSAGHVLIVAAIHPRHQTA
jgi:hypothetical protein